MERYRSQLEFHYEIKKALMMLKNGKVPWSIGVHYEIKKAVMMLKNGKVPESVRVPL